jgi:hypothetical protein
MTSIVRPSDLNTALRNVAAVLGRMADGEDVLEKDLDDAFQALLRADPDESVHPEYRWTWRGAQRVGGVRRFTAAELRREAGDYLCLAAEEAGAATIEGADGVVVAIVDCPAPGGAARMSAVVVA